VEFSYQKTKSFERLSFLYLITGQCMLMPQVQTDAYNFKQAWGANHMGTSCTHHPRGKH
jgi:hypothetical protein